MSSMLTQLFNRESLSRDEAHKLLRMITNAEMNDANLAAILAVYRMRPLTIDELAGFRDGLLEQALRVDLSSFNAIDVCGSGGDSRDSFNISTCAAFITAGAGVAVAKHGNYAASSKVGSSNVLEALGIKLSNNPDYLFRSLETAGICCLHAPLFHPAMKNVAPVRKALGFRTVFNILGPLVNPAQPKFQLIGTATHELARLYRYFLEPTGSEFMIVHSLDGFDEASLTSRMKLIGRNAERLVSPEDLGFDAVAPESLVGGSTSKENARIIIELLEGRSTQAKTAVALANAALAIQLARGLSNFEDALDAARESLASGLALRAMKKLVEASNDYAR